MLWILLITSKGGYKMHSAHTSRADAEAWEKCKQHDEEDTAILELSADSADDLAEAIDKARTAKDAAKNAERSGLPRP